MRTRSSLAWATILLAVCLPATRDANAQCKPDDPAGYFGGTAISKQAGKKVIESLNH